MSGCNFFVPVVGLCVPAAGGLEVLANDTCHAYNSSHCLVFPWLCVSRSALCCPSRSGGVDDTVCVDALCLGIAEQV